MGGSKRHDWGECWVGKGGGVEAPKAPSRDAEGVEGGG